MSDTRFIDRILASVLGLTFILFMHYLHKNWLPAVFADEWIYSSSARLLPLSESTTPSWLYLLLFKITRYCGENYLSCARLLNASLFVLSLPFIYSISRLVVSRQIALFIAAISLLGPINSYTAWFMPESMYYLSFWLLAWFVLTASKENTYEYGCGIGLILCAMSMIKMHAIFLLPAIMLFLLSMAYSQLEKMNIKKSLTIIFSICVTFLLLRSVLGFIFAGGQGLNIFGEKYNYNFLAIFDCSRIMSVIHLIKTPLTGHLLALTLWFGLPIAIMLNALRKSAPKIKILALFTTTCLVSLLFVTLFTTAQTAGWGPYEAINRIHMRYYNFMFPLFFIIAGTECYASQIKQFHYATWILALVVSIMIIIAITAINNYSISFIDCPELYGLTASPLVLKLMGLFGILCLGLWFIRKEDGAALYLFLFLPLALLSSNYYVTKTIYTERVYTRDAYDNAGQFARSYLGDEASMLAIVGKEQAGLYKTQFYIDNAKVITRALPDNMPIELANIPANIKWVLMIGNYPVLTPPAFTVTKDDFTLICRKISSTPLLPTPDPSA